METNQNQAQKQPTQLITPEATQPEQQTTEQPAPGQEQQATRSAEPQPEQPTKPLYDPDEVAQIVKHLTDGYFAPEYILLFGSLVGGTFHSDATAYDLLMVVRETPEYNWIHAKRILRYKVPIKRREVTYINLYIMTLRDVETHTTPFLYFVHAEGELLYCNDHYHFRRPKHPINFAKAYADAKLHYDTFRMLGNELIEQAKDAYYAYHGQEFDSHDPVIMHERMRTLSTKLMLALDDNHIENIFTLPCLKKFLIKARYDLDFDIIPQELQMHMERVEKMGEIIERYAGRRLELYKELSKQ